MELLKPRRLSVSLRGRFVRFMRKAPAFMLRRNSFMRQMISAS
jgi:hypothetical protein